MTRKTDQDWSNASHAGSRRAMIRRSLKLTVRERLLALEEMARTSDRLLQAKHRKAEK